MSDTSPSALQKMTSAELRAGVEEFTEDGPEHRGDDLCRCSRTYLSDALNRELARIDDEKRARS